MLNLQNVKAISLDLDDTLWPVWPTIRRAEQVLQDWLRPQAPRSADFLSVPEQRLALREEVQRRRPDIGHDLGTLRREVIRLALERHAEAVALVEPAYAVFIAERMKVDLFDDALPALHWLSARFPVVALSNGNADVHQVGIGEFFKAALSAQDMGMGKPDSRFFHAAAHAAGVAPHEVLHVGDDAALDVLAGREAGMQTVWVNRADKAWTHEAQPHARVRDLSQLCDLLRSKG
jgi:FMN hydrolase / 5-amino-6-(5-phospho-D-ribitylamino)uracil phosphatase